MKRFFHAINLSLAFVTLLSLSGLAFAADDIAPEVLKSQTQRIEAIRKASKASISVFASGGNGGGSGVVITPDGYALSNFHVVKPAGNFMKCSMPDGVLYDAVVVGIDPVGDVAMIKLLGRDDFPTAEIVDSNTVQMGDWCFAVGNPFLLATDFQPTVTWGIVSGVHRYQYPAGTLLEYADCIQTDAAINPGNSGGPLFNANGQLIGINGRGSFEKRGRVNVGVGYAISINQIQHFMGYLRSGRILDHATLGATVSTDVDGRVVVTNITEACDAYRRGLRYGDEIVRFGGRDIGTANAFKNVLGIFPKGWRVPLSYRRGDKTHDILVRLEGVHGQEALLEKLQGAKEAAPDEKKPRGEKPKEDKPGERKPMPIPIPGIGKAPPPPPAHLAKLFKVKYGYSNYYFNELNRDRVWKGFSAKGDFTAAQGVWKISGKTVAGSPVEFILGPQEATAKLPAGAAALDFKQELGSDLSPEKSGGMLLALHMWRKLLTSGPGKFGEVYYQGTVPRVERDNKIDLANLADVLVGTHDVIRTNFMFDPKTGELLSLEMYPESKTDPCEVYFLDYREAGGRWLPHQLEVRHGDNVVLLLKIDQWSLSDK